MKKLIMISLFVFACDDMGPAENWDSSPYTETNDIVEPDTDTGDVDTDTSEVDTNSDDIVEPDTDTTPKPEPECIYLQKKCVTPPESRCIDEFTLMDFRYPLGHCISGKCYYSWAFVECFCVDDDTGAHCEGEK